MSLSTAVSVPKTTSMASKMHDSNVVDKFFAASIYGEDGRQFLSAGKTV